MSIMTEIRGLHHRDCRQRTAKTLTIHHESEVLDQAKEYLDVLNGELWTQLQKLFPGTMLFCNFFIFSRDGSNCKLAFSPEPRECPGEVAGQYGIKLFENYSPQLRALNIRSLNSVLNGFDTIEEEKTLNRSFVLKLGSDTLVEQPNCSCPFIQVPEEVLAIEQYSQFADQANLYETLVAGATKWEVNWKAIAPNNQDSLVAGIGKAFDVTDPKLVKYLNQNVLHFVMYCSWLRWSYGKELEHFGYVPGTSTGSFLRMGCSWGATSKLNLQEVEAITDAIDCIFFCTIQVFGDPYTNALLLEYGQSTPLLRDPDICRVLKLYQDCWSCKWDNWRPNDGFEAFSHDMLKEPIHTAQLLNWLSLAAGSGYQSESIKGLFMLPYSAGVPARTHCIGVLERRAIKRCYLTAALARLGIEASLQQDVEDWYLPTVPGLPFLVSLKMLLLSFNDDSKGRRKPHSVAFHQWMPSRSKVEPPLNIVHGVKITLENTDASGTPIPPWGLQMRYANSSRTGSAEALELLCWGEAKGVRPETYPWQSVFQRGLVPIASAQCFDHGVWILWRI